MYDMCAYTCDPTGVAVRPVNAEVVHRTPEIYSFPVPELRWTLCGRRSSRVRTWRSLGRWNQRTTGVARPAISCVFDHVRWPLGPTLGEHLTSGSGYRGRWFDGDRAAATFDAHPRGEEHADLLSPLLALGC
jgi:hypothetical protein